MKARRGIFPIVIALTTTLTVVALLFGLAACGGNAGGSGGTAGVGGSGGVNSANGSTGSAGTGDATGATSDSPAADQPTGGSGNNGAGPVAVVKDADLIIPVSRVSKTASFFPVNIDGTQLEVIAVKAPDGSIRTAFNTCQVCYDSGQGYYVQKGDELECQSCGNRFGMDQVEVSSGGCNPVPIFDKDTVADAETITVPLSFLQESKNIFANWKN